MSDLSLLWDMKLEIIIYLGDQSSDVPEVKRLSRISLPGDTFIGVWPTRESSIWETTFTCPHRLFPPPWRDRPRERPDLVAPLAPEPEPAWPRRRTERPTGRREMAETRPDRPDLAPLPWSSEEDLVVASLSLSNFLVSSVCHLLKQNKH